MKGQFSRRSLIGYLFISPWLVGFVLFYAGPALVSLAYSFTDLDLFGRSRWIGLENYQTILFQDELFWVALWNTLFFALLLIPLLNLLALGLALLLNRGGRGAGLLRTIYFLPALMGAVVAAVLWRFIFGTNYGLLNAGLTALGLAPIDWLGDPNWTKPALVVMNLWTFGAAMLIDLAALQQVPRAYYDAARIDGANAWTRLRSITLPLLAPALFFNVVVTTIGALQTFTPTYIFTATDLGSAGPDNSLLFYVLYVYRSAFREPFALGYASALAWLLLVVIAALTWLQFRLRARSGSDAA